MKTLVALLALGAFLLAAEPARVDDEEGVAIVLLLAGPPLTASTALTIHDAVQAAQNQPVSTGAAFAEALAEALGAGPQAVFLNAFNACSRRPMV